MGKYLIKIGRLISYKGGLCLFLRAQMSAQFATLIDFTLTLALVNYFELYYVYATLAGSICGGIINAVINYRWTFKAKDCKPWCVAIKYFLVWLCSIALNTYGTYLFTEYLDQFTWIRETLSEYVSDYFIFSKLIVAIVVSCLWNYNMQRLFVYRRLYF